MRAPAPDAALNGLRREHPELEPWLVVVDEILREACNPVWDGGCSVPAPAQRASDPATGRSYAHPGRCPGSPSV